MFVALLFLLPLLCVGQPAKEPSPVVGTVRVVDTVYLCHQDGGVSVNGTEPRLLKAIHNAFEFMAFSECSQILDELIIFQREMVFMANADRWKACAANCSSSWSVGAPESDLVETATVCDAIKKEGGLYLEAQKLGRTKKAVSAREQCLAACGEKPALFYEKSRLQLFTLTQTSIFGVHRPVSRHHNAEAPQVDLGDALGEFVRNRTC